MKEDTTQTLWRTEFDNQASPTMFAQLVKRTTALTHGVESTSPWRETLAPMDRINTAIMKTLAGSYKWDPDRVGLDLHLLNVIGSDISHEMRRETRLAKRGVRMVSLDEDEDEQNIDQLDHDVTESLEAERVSASETPALLLVDVVARLRVLAARDQAVLRILDAYDQGAFTRSEIVRITGMSPRTYQAAYKRLVRLAQEIAVDVRAALNEVG
jgi:DNA-binding transcriptional ArsR family regulator